MRIRRPVRSLTLTAAIVAVLAELGLGSLGQIPAWLIYPIALATGGVVLWIALALDVLVRRGSRPDRKDIAAVRDLQGTNAVALEDHEHRLDQQAERLVRAEAHLRLLAIDPTLNQAERALDQAVARVETWEALADDLPAWNAALDRWSEIVVGLQEDFALDRGPATEAEQRAARAHLPPAANFSSQDLKLALKYLVQRERVLAVHARLESYRESVAPTGLEENRTTG